jgi:RimJ/RimL family protein N-acetyltransferase
MADGGSVDSTATMPVPTSDTFRQIMDEVVRDAAEDGAVIVGHAAHLVLRDRPGVLRVFVQAPLEARVQRLMRETGLPPEEARRQAETYDRERVRFYQDAYHVNWFDLRVYDCLVDTHLLGVHGAADTILAMAERVCAAPPEAAIPEQVRPVPSATQPAPPAAGEMVQLKSGAVSIRPVQGGDAPALLTFFRSLPPEDLLFLRRDVTDSAVIEAWERDVVDGRMFALVAESIDDQGRRGEVVGEASLRPSEVPWTRHIGEVRVVTSPEWRGRGLGTALLREVLHAAHDAGIEKVTAETLAEQTGAREMLSRLGFVEEGRYAGYARDLAGAPHDLIVMTHTAPASEAVLAH